MRHEVGDPRSRLVRASRVRPILPRVVGSTEHADWPPVHLSISGRRPTAGADPPTTAGYDRRGSGVQRRAAALLKVPYVPAED